MTPKEEFIELMKENMKVNGYDERASKIIAVVYIEPEEISLEEVAKRTGYSVSSVSTAIKPLIELGLLKRIKKSGKIYLYMEKDIVKTGIEIATKKYNKVISRTKDVLPGVIEDYENSRDSDKEELEIIEKYYKQITRGEKLMKTFLLLIRRFRR